MPSFYLIWCMVLGYLTEWLKYRPLLYFYVYNKHTCEFPQKHDVSEMISGEVEADPIILYYLTNYRPIRISDLLNWTDRETAVFKFNGENITLTHNDNTEFGLVVV